MKVVGANGRPLNGSNATPEDVATASQVELIDGSGRAIRARVTPDDPLRVPIQLSLWTLGGLFAALGSVLALRRPDLRTARKFVLYSYFSCLAFAVGPASAISHSPWALVIQNVGSIGIAASLFPLAIALVTSDGRLRWFERAFSGLAIPIALIYGATVVARDDAYQLFRVAILSYLLASVLGTLVVLASMAIKGASAQSRQARIVLFGIGVGMLPFLSLTLLPLVAQQRSLVPAHITVLFWGFIPATFAIAILQHRLFGIRKLIHRALVYGFASTGVFVLASMAVALSNRVFGTGMSTVATPIVVLVALAAYRMLHRVARWLIDRVIYRDTRDYDSLMEVIRADLVSTNRSSEVATLIVRRIAGVMQLESAALFLGVDPADATLVSAVGGWVRSESGARYAAHLKSLKALTDNRIIDSQWESQAIMVTPLLLSGRYCGHVAWGPKEDGDVFIAEEKRVLAEIPPILALVLEQSNLSKELAELNRCLVRAEEEERGRIARDLHDGPLQKALLLAVADGNASPDSGRVARQLAVELREICSRLRPAILDDLGLAPSLDWLLQEASKTNSIYTALRLDNVDDEARFNPDVELALFRVAQEAINNIVKHSKGSRVEIVLRLQGDCLRLEVTDNGTGFPVDAGLRTGFGLRGMRERVQQLAGSFEIISKPHSGTTIIASVPVSAEDTDE